MAFQTTYRTLFEVRILHTFHLEDESVFFALSYPDQISKLKEIGYDLRNDLIFEPTRKTKKLLNNLRAKFARTPSGFKIGIETHKNASNYQSLIPIDDSLFSFKIENRNKFFDNISNVPLSNSLGLNYYFNNHKNKTPISSSNLPTPINQTGLYVTSNDLKMIGRNFTYFFQNTSTDISFKLFDQFGLLISQSDTPSGEAVNYHFVDFSLVRDGDYILEIKDNAGTHIGNSPYNIYLNSQEYQKSDWGIIEIKNTSINGYEILNGNNLIDTRYSISNHPVFDIKIESRKTFRRYFRHPKDFVHTSLFDPVSPPIGYTVQSDSKVFESTIDTHLKNVGNPQIINGSVKLPSPTNFNLKKDGSKFISEIYLPKLNL